MANHGLAWIGLVAGLKLWHVADFRAPRPPSPTCDQRTRIEVLPPPPETHGVRAEPLSPHASNA